MTNLRPLLAWLAGAALGGAFLWLTFRYVDAAAVRHILEQAHLSDLLGIAACGLAFVVVKAIRWGLLLRHLELLSFRQLVGAVFAGSAVNFVVPHGGEFVRTWMVARRHGLPKAALLSSIAVERVFDFCAVLLLGLMAVLSGRQAFHAMLGYLWVLTGFIVVLLAASLPLVLWPAGSLRVLRSMLAPLGSSARDWVMAHGGHAIEGLGSLQQAHLVLKALGLSLVQWMLMAGCAWFSLRGAGVPPSAVMAVVIVLLLVVGLTLPAAPGHVGTTQVAFLLAAAPFAVGKEEAMAASLLYNALLPVPILLVGVPALLRARHNVAELREPLP